MLCGDVLGSSYHTLIYTNILFDCRSLWAMSNNLDCKQVSFILAIVMFSSQVCLLLVLCTCFHDRLCLVSSEFTTTTTALRWSAFRMQSFSSKLSTRRRHTSEAMATLGIPAITAVWRKNRTNCFGGTLVLSSIRYYLMIVWIHVVQMACVFTPLHSVCLIVMDVE